MELKESMMIKRINYFNLLNAFIQEFMRETVSKSVKDEEETEETIKAILIAYLEENLITSEEVNTLIDQCLLWLSNNL